MAGWEGLHVVAGTICNGVQGVDLLDVGSFKTMSSLHESPRYFSAIKLLTVRIFAVREKE